MKEFNYMALMKIKGENITYEDLLNTFEWKNKRDLIVNRDNNICTNCKSVATSKINGRYVRFNTDIEQKEYISNINESFKKSVLENLKPYTKNLIPDIIKNFPFGKQNIEKPIILHVHHKYYIKDNLPWEYDNDALTTVCQECHQNIHDNLEISVYSDESMANKLNVKKCFRCNGSGYLKEFHYFKNGICFRCNGNKYDEFM